MTCYGPGLFIQRKRREASGRKLRTLIACAGMVLGGITAGQAMGQGLLATPSSASFGNVNVGGSKTISVTLSNTERTAITIKTVSESGSAFSISGITTPLSISGGNSVVLTLKFAPQSTGAFSGYVSISSNATNATLHYNMTGTGTTGTLASSLAAAPSSASFGSVPIGTDNTLAVQLKNTGTSSVTVSSATVSGKGFGIRGTRFPVVLAAGKTSNVTLSFQPMATGYVAGSVSFASNATNHTLAMTMSGTGATATRTLTSNPTSVSFGNQQVGNSNTLAVTLKNTGNSVVTVSGVTTSGTGMTSSGVANGTALAAGQSATINVTFVPKTAGGVSGSVKVASNATSSPTTIGVSGSGITATAHTVVLSWSASSTAGVVGYRVYRATGTGGYAQLTTTVVSGLKYTDATVTSGTTYQYVVTAVGSTGDESAYSGGVAATVP